MNMFDIDETPKPRPTKRPTAPVTKEIPRELLKSAIPPNIAKEVDSEQINKLIESNAAGNTKVPKMEPKDFAKMMQIDNLPSKYRKYPEGTKLYGRPLNLRELMKLANINENNAVTVIDDILKCGTIKGLDLNKLLVGDKLYILLWLRANTYPESGYSVPFHCSVCDKDTTYDFKVDDIGINYIREDYDIEEPVELSNKEFITFKYLRIEDENKIQRFKESTRKSITIYDDNILILAATVNTINGESKTLMEAYNYISDPQIYSQIKGYVTEFDFGISNILNVKCNACGGMAQVGLSFREDFFVPAYRFSKFTRNAI